jgi:hypothetical protein
MSASAGKEVKYRLAGFFMAKNGNLATETTELTERNQRVRPSATHPAGDPTE